MKTIYTICNMDVSRVYHLNGMKLPYIKLYRYYLTDCGMNPPQGHTLKWSNFAHIYRLPFVLNCEFPHPSSVFESFPHSVAKIPNLFYLFPQPLTFLQFPVTLKFIIHTLPASLVCQWKHNDVYQVSKNTKNPPQRHWVNNWSGNWHEVEDVFLGNLKIEELSLLSETITSVC